MHNILAAFLFYFIYIHLMRNIIKGSYHLPRVNIFILGIIIIFLLIITAFIGYSLPLRTTKLLSYNCYN
jgi:quinol-cytochrome oxidoreductase complex cytochrome b subunit